MYYGRIAIDSKRNFFGLYAGSRYCRGNGAIVAQEGNCLGIYQPDMETLRTGNIHNGDVVCVRREDRAIYAYYSLVLTMQSMG